MPCYLDDLSPRGGEFPEGHRYGKRPWDFGKIYWSLRLAELGYTSLYLDNDVACMTDPLAADIVTSPFDVQVPSHVTSSGVQRLQIRSDARWRAQPRHMSGCAWRHGPLLESVGPRCTLQRAPHFTPHARPAPR